MRTYNDYIGGEICIGYTIGKGADGEREIQDTVLCKAIFTNGKCGKDRIEIVLDLSEHVNKALQNAGDTLAERNSDVLKIMDGQE